MNVERVKGEYCREAAKKENDKTETEVRLRICKLLRYYNLDDYRGVKFVSKEHILEESKKNKETAKGLKGQRGQGGHQMIGGILYNPAPDKDDSDTFVRTFFAAKKDTPTVSSAN